MIALRRHARAAFGWSFGACVLILAACSDASVVDQIRINNETDYKAHVEVTGAVRDGWLQLTFVRPDTTNTVGKVLDQGDDWVFRFSYAGHDEEVELSRTELERSDWTVDVPLSFEEGLREAGVTPPP
jgi:hypothetical protein